MKELLINIEPFEKRVAVVENNTLENFYLERKRDENILGNIYKGRIVNIVKGIDAAFVDIGGNKDGFLYLPELQDEHYEIYAEEPLEITSEDSSKNPKKEHLKPGQEIYVQVVREAIGTKAARLTTHLSITGHLLVFLPADYKKGVH